MHRPAVAVIIASILAVLPSCRSADRGASARPATRPSPFLLGLEPPVRFDGGHFPFFDRQLGGVHLVDRNGRRFTLGVPASDSEDRSLTLAPDAPFDEDGYVSLYAGGPTEQALLAAVRDELRRRGHANPPYSHKWDDGLGWTTDQQAAHLLRHAELERRLSGHVALDQRRRELHKRLRCSPVGEWHKRREAVFEFYRDTAAEYGLLGPDPTREKDE